MTDLLTRAEYSAIAETLDPPRSPFIDGKYQVKKRALMYQ